jgi:hypothetical protein
MCSAAFQALLLLHWCGSLAQQGCLARQLTVVTLLPLLLLLLLLLLLQGVHHGHVQQDH